MKHWILPVTQHTRRRRAVLRGRPRRGGSGGEVIQEMCWALAPRVRAQRSIVAFVGGAPPGTFMDATFCAFLLMHGGTALLSPACQ